KQAYKVRLGDLRDELEEATALNDSGRVDCARQEMEFLTEELARSVGLGGRSRKAASHTERARVNVTRAIGKAMTRIKQQSPALAAYLANTIKTGAFCSYTPDSRAPLGFTI